MNKTAFVITRSGTSSKDQNNMQSRQIVQDGIDDDVAVFLRNGGKVEKLDSNITRDADDDILNQKITPVKKRVKITTPKQKMMAAVRRSLKVCKITYLYVLDGEYIIRGRTTGKAKAGRLIRSFESVESAENFNLSEVVV
jgi:hypothetical protein